jgi:hypothetical protein
LKSNVQEADAVQFKYSKRNLNSEENILNAKIGKIQHKSQFRVIARQQKSKEELYLYLLQKKGRNCYFIGYGTQR